MSIKPNLLVKDNLVRHLSSKIENLKGISKIIFKIDKPQIIESLLALAVSYFEAAIVDTVREYVYAKPDEIYDLMLQKFDKKILENDREKIRLKGLDEYMIEKFLDKVTYVDNKTKIKKLAELTGIEVDIGNERWERILEMLARRNCLIHNDSIVNNTYFKQAGQKVENIKIGEKITIPVQYLSDRIEDLNSLLGEIKNCLNIAYQNRTNVATVKELWDYLFENHYPFIFEDCWYTDGSLIIYKGLSPEEIKATSSPRMICLFSAWMSFFGYAYNGDLKYFSEIFYLNAEDRKMYTKKLKYLMDTFEKIDFQSFGVQVYDKSS
ncbi:MAG: hypothetical protein JXB48_03520 [Candidatus Latescibacteria bacterium]|nr:hypothetical protein [Candidatus Latescibacterota bacterium]